jgi:hypothetical protein
MQLIIQTGGVVRCLYAETIDLTALGPMAIERASHVEPTPDGQWLADLSPVKGPVLGPFSQRSQALAAEAAWLHSHWLERPLAASAG